MNRIPTLDGWRAIAILMVLVTHYQEAFHHGYARVDMGNLGVQIFFVLSGYLITSHLMAENRIDLKGFYIRRAFRILPASLSYLFVLALLTTFTPLKVSGDDVWACLLLFRNYTGETAQTTCTGHFWSLSLEEQFYLAWPTALVLLGRLRAAVTAAVFVAAIALFRILNWSFYSADLRFQRTEVRADGLLIGCLLALVLTAAPLRRWVEGRAAWFFWSALPILIIDAFRFHRLIPLHESLAIAAMIGATSLRPRLLIGRALEWEWIKATGLLSYSIYIWQGLFLRPNWGIFWPILLVGSFLLSYAAVEQPARRLGRRLAARLSPAEVPHFAD